MESGGRPRTSTFSRSPPLILPNTKDHNCETVRRLREKLSHAKSQPLVLVLVFRCEEPGTKANLRRRYAGLLVLG